MKLFENLLNRKNVATEIEIVDPMEIIEPIDERRQELATIQVKDIKQYLLDEYERSQQLYKKNQELQKKLLATSEIKTKYDATLVTLDEYDNRLKAYEKEFLNYEEQFQRCRQETEDIRDELNNYKIKFQRAAISKDEIKEEIVQETKGHIIEAIMAQKGNISKAKVVDIIRDVTI